MSGPQGLRLVELVDRAHPHRIARHGDEWERCGRILADAADQIDRIASRHSELGGRTGPSMARAMALASDVLRVKSDDLMRGSAALREVADATQATQERKRAIDRDHPDDGLHVAWREEGSRVAADGQESTLLHAIAVMKSIEAGEDPHRPITTVDPDPVVVHEPPTFWPPPVRPLPPLDVDVDPDDDVPLGPNPAYAQGPGQVPAGPGGSASLAGPSSYGGSSTFSPGALAGAAVLGAAGVAGAAGLAAGGRAAASTAGAPAAGRIGGSAAPASGGVLGRGAGGAAGGGAGAPGGRGGRRRKDDRSGEDRDLHDDGEGWLDDEAGPDVLR